MGVKLMERGVDAHFVEFVQRHTDSLVTTASLLTHSRAAGEELVQDTLVALYGQWQKVSAADSSLAYVRRSMLNRFLNQKRARKTGEIPTETVPDIVIQVDFTRGVADRQQLRQALRTLPERQQVALVLRYFHDLSDEEAALALDCRVGTLRSLISRALATLRTSASFDTDGGAAWKGTTR